MFGPPHMHEIFCPLRNGSAGLASVAQILDKAGIANRQSPEFCPGHVSFTQKYFDFSQQWHR